MNDEFWDHLNETVSKIPENWNQRLRTSLDKERAETEKRYNIRMGQTDIDCARCARKWGLGRHTCQDIRFDQLQEKEEKKRVMLKDQTDYLINCIREVGTKKLSTISFDGQKGSFISEKAINQWIYRRSIPLKSIERIESLINRVLSPQK